MPIRSAFPAVFLLLVIGCAVNPVPVDLPLNHPSDPGAPESRFILPPNPFGADMTSAHPQAHDQSESVTDQRKSRGDLFELPAGKSVAPGPEKNAGDRSPSGMPHQHHMKQGQ
jgi:hypothetical protein